jgi:hypothetical protein
MLKHCGRGTINRIRDVENQNTLVVNKLRVYEHSLRPGKNP